MKYIIIEHVFFPRKTTKAQSCYFGLLFSFKKGPMGHSKGRKAKRPKGQKAKLVIS